jgi:hypothetical protein
MMTYPFRLLQRWVVTDGGGALTVVERARAIAPSARRPAK